VVGLSQRPPASVIQGGRVEVIFTEAAAPVTIVEFSDFHCPFCKRVLPTLRQLESQ
jgi:protein-disulfide isomerase